MTHADLVHLIEKGIPKNGGGIWADFGSGDGAFTLALRDITGPKVQLYSIDRDALRLDSQAYTFMQTYPDTKIKFLHNDFTKQIDLPPLDGLLAANSIHFHKDTVGTIKKLVRYLKPGGSFIVVEYSAERGNIYVPHPFRFETFATIAPLAGLENISLLSTIDSTMLNEIYAAKATKREEVYK